MTATRKAEVSEAGLFVATLFFVGLVILSSWSFFRMVTDEQKIMISKSHEFETRLFIDNANCDWGMFKFSCSGLLTSANSPSVGVRYSCDRETCAFECGK